MSVCVCGGKRLRFGALWCHAMPRKVSMKHKYVELRHAQCKGREYKKEIFMRNWLNDFQVEKNQMEWVYTNDFGIESSKTIRWRYEETCDIMPDR